MALDDDGSILAVRHQAANGLVQEKNATERSGVNDEDNSNQAFYNLSGPQRHHTMWLFPELREFDGIFIAQSHTGGDNWEILSSADTTNFIDGTWTQRIVTISKYGSSWPTNYRQNITSQAVSNVRAVRLNCSYWNSSSYPQRMHAFHLYGEISAGETPDRLLFIDELTGLEFTLSKDYGEAPRGSSEDFEWRIKNNSAGLTANTIQYTAEDNFLGSGAWYTYTLPGGSTYAATQSIASLAPATTTGLIVARRITPGGEDLGLHAGRTYLNTASWS